MPLCFYTGHPVVSPAEIMCAKRRICTLSFASGGEPMRKARDTEIPAYGQMVLALSVRTCICKKVGGSGCVTSAEVASTKHA